MASWSPTPTCTSRQERITSSCLSVRVCPRASMLVHGLDRHPDHLALPAPWPQVTRASLADLTRFINTAKSTPQVRSRPPAPPPPPPGLVGTQAVPVAAWMVRPNPLQEPERRPATGVCR